MTIADNLGRVREQIARAAVRAGRSPDEITLVGVSKTHPASDVAEAVRAGLVHVGENRVQEAAAKFPSVLQLLGAEARPIFHMIGHLQTNKAGAAVELFSSVDAVDSVRLASALSRHVSSGLSVLVEVYVGDDPRRPGVRPDQLVDVVRDLVSVPHVIVEGLMSVAPLGADPRSAFERARELKQILAETFPVVHFGRLSMGMSEDFVEAIEAGSTEVRIGTAIFGPRQQFGPK